MPNEILAEAAVYGAPPPAKPAVQPNADEPASTWTREDADLAATLLVDEDERLSGAGAKEERLVEPVASVSYRVLDGEDIKDYAEAHEAARAFHNAKAENRPSLIRTTRQPNGDEYASVPGQTSYAEKDGVREYGKFIGGNDEDLKRAFAEVRQQEQVRVAQPSPMPEKKAEPEPTAEPTATKRKRKTSGEKKAPPKTSEDYEKQAKNVEEQLAKLKYQAEQMRKVERNRAAAQPSPRAAQTAEKNAPPKNSEEFEKLTQQLEAAAEQIKIHLLQDPMGRHIVVLDGSGQTKSYAVHDNPAVAARTATTLRERIKNIGSRIAELDLLPDVIKTKFRLKSGQEKVVYNVDPEGIDPRHSVMREAGLTENDRRNLVVTPVAAAPGATRVLKTNELPENVKKRFIVSDTVPGQYFDRNRKLVFVDKGNRLTTDENTPEVIESMISLAKTKGWASITVNGHEDFRREAWLAASLAGIEVKGYKPSEQDIARLDHEKQQRMTNSIQGQASPAPANEIEVATAGTAIPIGKEAVAIGEVARAKGLREDQVPALMKAAQNFLDQAKQAGIDVPPLKMFDPKAPAQTRTNPGPEASDKAPSLDFAQPKHGQPRR